MQQDQPAQSSPWTVGRVDLRSPVSPNAWPVARVELDHSERGRVTDIGTSPGAFDAAFAAASNIVGIAPALTGFNVRSMTKGESGALSIVVDIDIEHGGQTYRGTGEGLDLIECSLRAWLDAVAAAVAAAP